jgi:hypothetical protein
MPPNGSLRYPTVPFEYRSLFAEHTVSEALHEKQNRVSLRDSEINRITAHEADDVGQRFHRGAGTDLGIIDDERKVITGAVWSLTA